MIKFETNDEAKKINFELIYSIALIAVLCFLGGNRIASLFVLVGFIPLILKPEFLIGPIFFATIWGSYIVVLEGQSLSRYLVIFFIAGVVMKMLVEKSRLNLDFWFGTSVAAILLGLALSLWGIYDYTSIPTSYILNFLLLIAILHCPISSKELLIKQLWCFSVLSVMFGYWFLLRNGLDAFESGKIGMLEEGVNSNSVGKGICILIIIILAHFLIKGFKGKFVHIALILVSILLLFLTGSRTSFVAFLIAGIIIVLYWMKLNAKKIWKAALIIGIAVVGFYFVYNYLLEALPSLMQRFTFKDTLEDGGTGRVDVWKAYIEVYLPEYWFIGVGFDPLNLFHAIKKVNGIGHGAHNHIIDMLASTGIVGLMLYSWMHIKGLRIGSSYAKTDITILLPWSMLIATLLLGIGENVLRGRILWLSLALIVVFKNLIDKEKEHELVGEKS